jgi:voltage-gated potassium channel Kch
MGFSIAIGAFAAGVAIGNLPYNFQIIGKIKPLRDYFATLFFATLGLELVFTSVETIIVPLLILLFLVVVLKPLVVIVITSVFGYTRKTSFMAGINLAQVSEFSLIIVAEGMLIGQISREIFSIAVILAIITIVMTSYFVKFDKGLYRIVKPFLKPLNLIRTKKKKLSYMPNEGKYKAILLGYDRIGFSIMKAFKKLNKKFIVVDFNPDIIKRLIKEKIPCIYGDIGDLEILERLDLNRAEIVISTVPELKDNKNLISYVKERNKRASIFVTANRIHEALDLYEAKADYVILPHFLGGHHVSLMLENTTGNLSSLLKNKINHITELKKRKDMGFEHPKVRRDKEET